MTDAPAADVLLIAGSPSDLDLVLACEDTLEQLGLTSHIRLASAHRTPDLAAALARDAADQGYSVVITFAGMAAHLGGVVAAHTVLPVIQVPVASGALRGIDAALASLQMPPGVPLAAVAIDGARNAALLAARILSVARPELREKLVKLHEKDRARYGADVAPDLIAQARQARRTQRG
jgi:5-(carboxyamino)imidazole ribonucleotide mutase